MNVKYFKLTIFVVLTMVALCSCSGGSNVSGTSLSVNTNQTPNSLYIGNVQGLVFKNESVINGSGFATTLDYNSVSALAENQNGIIYAATTGGNLWQYNDHSGIWDIVTGGSVPDGGGIYSMGISSGNKLYVGTSRGNVFLLNNGSWQQQGGSQEVPSSGYILAMTIIGESVYVGSYITNQTDTGQVYLVDEHNWTQQGYNPMDRTQILSLTNLNGAVYAGSTAGYLYNVTADWLPLGSTPESDPIRALATFDNNIYLGTTNGNTYSVDATTYDWKVLTSTNDPDGGTIMAIAIDKTGTIYASTNNMVTNVGAIYIIKDHAWNLYGNGLSPDNGVNSLLIDQGNQLYAGTSGSSTYNITPSDWILLGTNSSPDNSSIYSVALYNQVLYVGTSLGNLYAVDKQHGWQHVSELISPDNSAIYTVATSNSGKIFVSTDGNSYTTISNTHAKLPHFIPKYRSYTHQTSTSEVGGSVYQVTDNGWIQIGGISSPDNSAVYTIAISNSDDIYAGTQTGSIYFIHNNSWQQQGMSPNGNSVFSIAICGNNVYAAAGDSVYLVDSNSWKVQGGSTPPDGYLVYALYCDINSNTLYAGTGAGHVYSLNNNSWTKLSSSYDDGSLNYSAVYSLAVDPNTRILYASTQSAGIWAYSQGMWSKTNTGNGATVYSIALGN